MEAIPQQMVVAKKNELTNTLKEVNAFAKSLALLLGCKGSLAIGRGQ